MYKSILFRRIAVLLVITFIWGSSFGVYAQENSDDLKWGEKSVEEKNKIVGEIVQKIEINSAVLDSSERNNIDEMISGEKSLNVFEGKTESEISGIISAVYSNQENLILSNSDIKYNVVGGRVTEPVTYLRNWLGSSSDVYTVVNSKYMLDVARTLQSSWGDKQNCTLVALYNIMPYYRKNGYSKIFSSDYAVYMTIRAEASKLGYTAENGLGVTKNDSLVKNTWRDGFGYSTGSGFNNYLWVDSSAINLINDNRPFIFSMACEPYYDHSITVYGYTIYKNTRTNKKYTFLAIADNYSTAIRYLPWTNTPESYVACMTSVTPPDSKTE